VTAIGVVQSFHSFWASAYGDISIGTPIASLANRIENQSLADRSQSPEWRF
jgi:hypothetical protein